MTRIRSALAIACALAASCAPIAIAHAQSKDVPAFAPYTGTSGYQEIDLGNDTWYVAFHGTRDHGMQSLEAGWLARSAQLCSAAGKQFVVELKYVGEPVSSTDRLSSSDETPYSPSQALPLRVAGSVPIPIFIPSGPREITPILTPSKMAPARCLATAAGLRDGKTAVSIAQALETARGAGLKLP